MKWKSNKVPDDNPNEMGAYYAEVIDPETYASKEIRWSIKKCVQDMKSTQEQPEEQEPEEVRITPEQIEQFKKDHKFYDKDKNGNPVK